MWIFFRPMLLCLCLLFTAMSAKAAELSDWDLWFANPPSFEIQDGARISPELAALMSRTTWGSYRVDAEADDAFRSCREAVSGRLGINGLWQITQGSKGVIAAIFAAGKTIAAARNAGREYRGCVATFTEKYQQALELAQRAGISKSHAKIKIHDFGPYAVDTLKYVNKQNDSNLKGMIELGDQLQDVDALYRGQNDQVRSLSDFVLNSNRSPQDASAEATRVLEIQETIEVYRQGINLFASFAFAGKPHVAQRIQLASDHLSLIGKSIAILTSKNAPIGAAAMAAQLNVVTGMMGLVSLATDVNDGTSDLIFEQLTTLNESIATLRTEMHERFDKIEAALKIIATHLDSRIDRLSKQVATVSRQLKEAMDRQKMNAALASSYLAFIAAKDFDAAKRDCFFGISLHSMDMSGFSPCASKFREYALSLSSIDAVTGQYLYVPGQSSDPILDIASFTPGYTLGYLTKAIEDISQPTSGTEVRSISPEYWTAGVDYYVRLLDDVDNRPKLRADGYTSAGVMAIEKVNIKSLYDWGALIKRNVAFVRAIGPDVALSSYDKSYSALISTVVSTLNQVLLEWEVGSFERRKNRKVELRNEEDTGGYDGRHWYRARFAIDTEWFGTGEPFKGAFLFREQRRFYTGSKIHMPQYQDGARLSELQAYVHEHAESLFVNVDSPSPDAIRQRLAEVNRQYLKVASYSSLDKELQGRINSEILAILKSEPLEPIFRSLKFSKSLAARSYVVLRKSLSSEETKWLSALMELPDTPTAVYDAFNKAGADSTQTTEKLIASRFMRALILRKEFLGTRPMLTATALNEFPDIDARLSVLLQMLPAAERPNN